MGSLMNEQNQQLLDLIFRVGLNILALSGVIFLWHKKMQTGKIFHLRSGSST